MTNTAEITTSQTLTHAQYPAYKDSGVDWLGEIPAHWQVVPLTKYASRIDYRGKTPEKVEEGIFLVTTKNIKAGKIDYDNSKEYVLEKQYKEIMSRGIPKIGDILFTMEAPLGMSAVVDDPSVAIAQRIIKFQFNELAFNSGFVNYSIQANYFQTHLQREGTGSTALGIKASKLHKLKLLKPPLQEQTRIAEFLDQKTTQINQAIAQKERLIGLLNERRQVMIHKALTRGLNPDVPMKDSGIDWIGEIPAHWEATKVKNIFRLTIEPAPNNNDFELLSVYTDIGVKPRKELEERGNKASTTDGYWLVKKGDIIVNKLLAWMGAIGLSEYDGVTSPAYDILRPKRPIAGEFYHALFRSPICSSELKRHSRGIMDMRLRLYFDKFGDILVPYPPIAEQREITERLHQIDFEVNKGKGILGHQIQKLQELKSTLINSAVTGKIKV